MDERTEIERTDPEAATGPLIAAGTLALVGTWVWTARDRAHTWAAGHRVIADADDWHLTLAGQAIAGGLGLGLLAALATAATAAGWWRWHRAGGIDPVPAVPLGAPLIGWASPSAR